MYEKPQYFTKDGFKRLAKNPHKDTGKSPTPLVQKPKQLSSQAVLRKKNLNGPGISDDTALLIANVLKGMLK
jgi:hypothetical protein